MHIVFDLDGVLVDTRALIRAAYLEAGVVAPANILELEGSSWLVDAVGADAFHVHETKNLAYVELIQNAALAPLLPPWAVACRLDTNEHVIHMLSAAPPGTDTVLRRRFQLWPFTDSQCGLRTPDKMTWLRDKIDRPGVYVDDQVDLLDLPDGWRCVHYVGQSAQELYDEIIGE